MTLSIKSPSPLLLSDMLSPSVDPEVPMDYSSEYDSSDKSSMDDLSDDTCSIPGSFSPDNHQDGASGDQRSARTHSLTHPYSTNTHMHALTRRHVQALYTLTKWKDTCSCYSLVIPE